MNWHFVRVFQLVYGNNQRLQSHQKNDMSPLQKKILVMFLYLFWRTARKSHAGSYSLESRNISWTLYCHLLHWKYKNTPDVVVNINKCFHIHVLPLNYSRIMRNLIFVFTHPTGDKLWRLEITLCDHHHSLLAHPRILTVIGMGGDRLINYFLYKYMRMDMFKSISLHVYWH